MPTYPYHCTSCDYNFDLFQKITEDPVQECPKCKKNDLKRKVGGGSAIFRFQGSGYYVNDYKKKDCKGPCGCKKKSE